MSSVYDENENYVEAKMKSTPAGGLSDKKKKSAKRSTSLELLSFSSSVPKIPLLLEPPKK